MTMETIRTNTSLNFTLGVLTFCGVWMPASLGGTWKAVLFKMFSCFMYTGTLIAYLNLGDMDKNIETSILALSVLTASFKAMKIMTGRRRIQSIMDKLEEPNFSCVSKANTKHLLKAMMITNICGKLLMFTALGTAVLWGALPLLNKSDELELPLRAWFPWDRSVRSTFTMLYIYQVISIAVLGALNASQDVLMCGIVILICGQLDVLYSEISVLAGKQKDEVNSFAADKFDESISEARYSKFQLRRCILHQKEIINCVGEVESLFSGVILIQFLGSCVVICVTAFQLSVTPFSMEFISNLFYMSTILGELFLFCYPGNELMLKSALISDAAYQTRWYDQDLAFRKMLILVMERSNRPITVTAGRILPLTLATLTSVLRSSYSYYAVLHTMHDA